MNILFVETNPEVETEWLPPLLQRHGEQIGVIMPLFGEIQIRYQKKLRLVKRVWIEAFSQWIGVFTLTIKRCRYFFIENSTYFGIGKQYTKEEENQRCLFFSAAVVEILQHLPWQVDIVHLKGCQSALIPFLMAKAGVYLPTVLELSHPEQVGSLSSLEIPKGAAALLDSVKAKHALGMGVLYSTHLLTSSPMMAKELLSPHSPYGLDALLRQCRRQLTGIVLESLDTKLWNPLKDPHLIANFGKGDFRRRQPNEVYLRKKLGIPIDSPLIYRIPEEKIPEDLPLYLGSADFVVTDLPHLYPTMAYGAIPICNAPLPPPFAPYHKGGTVLSTVAQAKAIYQNLEAFPTICTIRQYNGEHIRQQKEVARDFISLYDKIQKSYKQEPRFYW